MAVLFTWFVANEDGYVKGAFRNEKDARIFLDNYPGANPFWTVTHIRKGL